MPTRDSERSSGQHNEQHDEKIAQTTVANSNIFYFHFELQQH